MLKVNIGWSQKRLAQLVAFGLSEGNLLRLPKDPIYIDGKDIDIEAKFAIYHTRISKDEFKSDFLRLCKLLDLKAPENINALNLENLFFITILPVEPITYLIGFHETSYERLRDGDTLSFRNRIINGEGQNIEVNIFWGQTEDEMLALIKQNHHIAELRDESNE